MAKKGKVLEQKKCCSLSWEPLREFTAVVLLFFPQVLLRRSTLKSTLLIAVRDKLKIKSLKITQKFYSVVPLLLRPHRLKSHKKCDQCAYSLIMAQNLKNHKQVHSGEKPYSCDRCDFSSKASGNLKQHKRLHTGEKPFSCDRCNYSSSQRGHLKTHNLMHSGEKPYKCDQCAYS